MRPDLLATKIDPSNEIPGDLLFEPYVDAPRPDANRGAKPTPKPAFFVEPSADADPPPANAGQPEAKARVASADDVESAGSAGAAGSADGKGPDDGESDAQRELRLTATLNLKSTGFLGHAQKLILGDEPEPLSSAARISTGLLVLAALIGFAILTVLAFVLLFK